MSDAIKERLRHVANCGIPDFTNSKLLDEAADRIEKLEAALQLIVNDYENQEIPHVDYRVGVYRVARAALDKDA